MIISCLISSLALLQPISNKLLVDVPEEEGWATGMRVAEGPFNSFAVALEGLGSWLVKLALVHLSQYQASPLKKEDAAHPFIQLLS